MIDTSVHSSSSQASPKTLPLLEPDAARLAARQSGQVVLNLLRQHFRFDSMLDVGCGTGTWLAAALASGTQDVIGVDGVKVDPQLLGFESDLFQHFDLNEAFDLKRRFGLVVSIEAGEHVRPTSAATLVQSIVRHGDTVLFSAAIPGQGGSEHINENWPEVWALLFNAEGFDAFDVIRRSLWGNEKVESWVQQNAILFIRRGLHVPESLEKFRITGNPLTMVHRTTYSRMIRRVSQLKKELSDRQKTSAAQSTCGVKEVGLSFEEQVARQASTHEVTDLLVKSLRSGTPCSLVRLSHCESKFLNWPSIFTREEINKSLKRQFGYVDLSDEDIGDIGTQIRTSVACSDIVGVPVLTAAERIRMDQGEYNYQLWNAVAPACERHRLLHSDTVITSPNIHLRLQDSGFLEHLVEVAPSLTLVGCRDLRAQFTKYGFKSVNYIPVPEAYRTRQRGLSVIRHYPEAFENIIKSIRMERRGGLFFVGAGVLGKVYCREARLAGGIAIDVGSVMDVWAGVVSRTGFESRVQLHTLETR